MSKDGVKWYPRVTVRQWTPTQVADVQSRLGIDRDPTPGELVEFHDPEYKHVEGNLLTTAGLARITALITGAGGNAVTNTTARIGVGDTNTAAAVGNTDLAAIAGSTHRFFMTMAATYPTTSNGLMTFQSIFGTADGNFAWAEWGIDVGTATVTSGTTVNAVLLNRAVASLGTKVSGALWTFTATITLS